ncbi:hypothetical protein LGT39_04885 [Demequina sp. TTPB684]|uniref:hypothetical protein n=1 Tax=unclassified Demequina TaxID=2620311 RepID=UPI001CF287E5|nr:MULTISPECIES: hypothetical protein [unclassified Demequina]MCB2412185.1 hypothetical protein [Demequina sp. TTPB684]UPU88390.1 hypothetical protein LGT36_000235 [Demequina sp. TMPB413]
MTGYDIALSVALGLVAATLQRSVPLRGFAWRYSSARLSLAAQCLMVVVLVAGLLWGPEDRTWALLLAGWMGGVVIGDVVSVLRPQTPRDADTDATPQRGRPS